MKYYKPVLSFKETTTKANAYLNYVYDLLLIKTNKTKSYEKFII